MDGNINFHDLIDKEKYQVFLFSSLCSIPFVFARHHWFVVNQKGNLNRWEIVHMVTKMSQKHWGFLSLNFLPTFSGINIIPFYFKHFYFKTKFLGYVSGDDNSLAKKMADFIENSPNTYIFSKKYSYVGPNSNT